MLSFPILQKRSPETLALSIQLQSLESRVLEPTLPMGPHKGVRGGSSKKSGEQLVPPSTKIRLPTPYSCSGLTSPPSQISGGNLGWRQCSVLEGCWGRAEPPGVWGGGSRVGTGEERGSELHAPGGGSRGAEFPKEKEPIQSQEGRGENLVWCLTRGEEGGQGWALLICFSPQLPLQQGLAGQPRKGDV